MTIEMMAEIVRGPAKEGLGHVQVVDDPNTLTGVEAFRHVLDIFDRPRILGHARPAPGEERCVDGEAACAGN